MARLASTSLVIALLAATAAAFGLTEGLKLTPSPILGTRVAPKAFSPVCECTTDRVSISFRVRNADRLTVRIVDGTTVVRTLVVQQLVRPGSRIAFRWNGLDDGGAIVPDRTYKARVHFQNGRRTIELPNEIKVDTRPPGILSASLSTRVISPDGDHRGDKVVVRYRLDEDGRGILLVNGKRRVVTKFARAGDSAVWFGIVKRKPVRSGEYELALRARDPAGNIGEPLRLPGLVVRYVTLGRDLIDAVAGRRFAVRLSADAAGTWLLDGRNGTAKPGTLRLRAPARPGSYTLYVLVGSHAARATVVVRAVP